MKSRNIKVVDEHNIDRVANIVFGMDLEGSEYVVYWIERDEESNNVFVSKVVKNLDNTFNLANIEEEFEKESVSKIVKDLIAKAVSDDADKLAGETLTLSDGKNIKFISVSFNKEQRLDVKKTYITTVKKEVTRVSEKYYDVVLSVEEPQIVDIFPEQTQDIFPEVVASAPEKVEEVPTLSSEPVVSTPATPVIPEAPLESVVPEVSESATAISEVNPIEETLNDEFVAFGVQEKTPEPVAAPVEVASQEPVGAVVESITNQALSESTPVLETPTVDVKTEEVPVLEAPVTEKSEQVVVPAEVLAQATPAVEEPKVVLPEPIVPTPITPVIPQPVAIPPVSTVASEPVAAAPVTENQPLVFNASKETNLNAALGEVAKDTTIPVENIEVVREFGEEGPVLPQTPVSTAQPAIAPMVQPEMVSDPKALTRKAGFANNKFFMVVAIAFFLASCVFLGYEVFNYFQLTK
ncbi:MAG: DUF1292 domain-containing protein [Bacilli bacterium]|nr:DUF1292 domain-containing protein [Bacilli bacterium]